VEEFKDQFSRPAVIPVLPFYGDTRNSFIHHIMKNVKHGGSFLFWFGSFGRFTGRWQ
jgi:hypothetical protein